MSEREKLEGIDEFAESIQWPTVPQEIAGTDASRPWIEGRDAAVRAFIAAVADFQPTPSKDKEKRNG